MSLPFPDESSDQYNNQSMPKFQLRHTPYTGKFTTNDQSLFDSKDIATHSQTFDIVSPCMGTGDAMLQMQNPPLLAFRNKTNIQKVVTPNLASPKGSNSSNHSRNNVNNILAQSSLLQRRPLTSLKDPEILSLDVVRKNIEQEKMTIDFKEDPVAYFSKRKDGRGHRFIYLVYNGDPHDPHFSPYDLVKVPFAEIKGDYFTMSATGVTHVFDDGTTETISLDSWAREKSIFNSIRKLKIFSQFFYWKSFRIWKNFVMHERYNELEAAILYHPFFKNKEFFSLSLFIYNNQTKAKNLLFKFLLAFQSQRKYKLQEFIETNRSNIEYLKSKYEKFINKTMLEVQSLYTTISNPKLVQVHDSDFPDIKRRNPNLAQLMVLEKRKATKRMAKTEAVNRQIMEIGGFVRLIDYMLLESLAEGCHDSWKSAESNVTSDRSSIFVIDVLFDNNGKVTFSPTLDVLVESIEAILHESLKTLNLLPRLLTQLPLKPFLRDNGLDYIRLFEEGPQFSQIMDRDLLKQINVHIIEEVKSSYHECLEVSQSFSNFYPIYRMGQTWNVSDYLITPNGNKFKGNLNYDLSEEVVNDDFLLKPDEQPVVDFQRVSSDINKFREDRKRVENMRNGAARGALFIDSKGLKAILAPISDKALSEIQELLEKLSFLKIDRLRFTLQNYSRKLKQEPQTLDDYVSFCELIERCQTTTPQIEHEIEFIDKLFQLFDKFGFHHDENPNHTLFTVFTNDKNKALSTKTDQLGIFTEAIKGLIAEIERKIGVYFERATSIPETLKDIDIDVCLDKSNKLYIKIDNLKPRVLEAIRQQKIMEVSFSDFKNYDSLKTAAAFAIKLYNAVNNWLTLNEKIIKIPFKQMKIESFKDDVLTLKKETEKLKEEAPSETNYPLLDELLAKIDEIAPFMQQLEQLSNGKMQLRHWNMLFESCNHKDGYHEDITIAELSDLKILHSKEKIEEITATSQGESELEGEFVSIMNYWEKVQLPLAETQIKIEETLLLGQTDSLLLEIQDALANLSRMLSLSYVQGIREDVSNLSYNLDNVSLIIETWQLFQANWIVLSALFSIPEAKTILPNQASKFTTVQKRWGLIAHHTLKDTRLFKVCNYPNILEMLKENNQTMESILVSLGKYLDTKRQSAPRLFFLGNSEVLTLLTTSNIGKFTSILTKAFMHIDKIDCHENDGAEGENTYKANNFQRLKIFGFIGEDGDSIQFQRHVQFNSSIDVLINQITESMKTTVKDGISASIPGCQSGSFVDWVMTTPTYISFIALNVVFCNEMEDCFATYESNPRAFQQYENILKRRIEDATDSFLMPLSLRDKRKLNVILAQLLGFRDRFRMATEKIQNHSPYLEWLNSLRFRFLPNSTSIQVEFSDVKLDHGYEYWGKTPLLIHTPTIDSCLSDCIYSFNHNQLPMITSSAGSAKQVIGKTLACLFGQFAYIIRPFPDMSEYFLSRILTGVVSTGALAIFNGIEKLPSKSLCYLYDNVYSIISSLEAGNSRITISSKSVDLNKNCKILFTADSNFMSYGNIPPQIKSYARPISLLSPNYSKIIEIYLISTGFRETKNILPKFSSFIQTIQSIFASTLPNLSLSSKIFKICLRAKNMAKKMEVTLSEDLSIVYNSFKSFSPFCDTAHKELLKDILFNAFQIGSNANEMMNKIKSINKEMIDSQFVSMIDKEISALQLELPSSYLTSQAITLYNMMQENNCIIIVGPPNSGKSTVLEILKKVFDSSEISSVFPEEKKIEILSLYHLSEKWPRMYGQVSDDISVGTTYLYGEIQSAIYHILTNYEDKHKILRIDGKLTKSFSSFISELLGSPQSGKLMLNSLETFQYSPNFHLIIETDSLSEATPSLLAKSGILFMKNLQLEIPYTPISPPCVLTHPSIPFARALKRCLHFVDQNNAQIIRSVFCKVSPAIVQKIYHMKNLVYTIEKSNSNKLQNGHILLGEILPMYSAILSMITMEYGGVKHTDENQIMLCVIISFARIYSGILSFSQFLEFNNWLCSEYKIDIPKDWVGFTVSPAFSECFEHPQLISVRVDQGKVIPLSSSDLEKPPVFSNSANSKNNLPLFVDELNVIHPQVLPALHITQLLLMSRQNIIIHGPMDSGKTSFLPIIFANMKNIEPIVINASCYTTGESITNYLSNHTTLIAKSKNHPSINKNYVLVFDGIDETHTDLMEIIRMIITEHSIPRFSPDDQKVFEYSNLLSFSVIVTTRCYNELPTRFLSYFAPVALSSITENTASFIGSKVLQTYGFSKQISENLMKASIMTITQFPFMSIIHNIMSICSSLCFLERNEDILSNALMSELFYTCLHKYKIDEYKEKIPSIFSEYFNQHTEEVRNYLQFDPLIYPSFEITPTSIRSEIMSHPIQELQEELNYYLTLYNTNSIEKISIKFSSVTIREWLLLYQTLTRPGHNALLFGNEGSGRFTFSRFIAHQVESNFVNLSSIEELLSEKSRSETIHNILKNVIISAVSEKKRSIVYIHATNDNEKDVRIVADLATKLSFQPFFSESELDDLYEKAVQPKPVTTMEREQAKLVVINIIRYHVHFLINVSSDLNYQLIYNRFDSIEFQSDVQENYLSIATNMLNNEKVKQIVDINESDSKNISNLLQKAAEIARKFSSTFCPNKYYDFMDYFSNLIQREFKEIDTKNKNIISSLKFFEKLKEESVKVNDNLNSLTPNLQKLQTDSEALQVSFNNRKEAIESRKKKLEEDAEQRKSEINELNLKYNENEQEKSNLTINFEKAIKEVEKLSDNDIETIRITASDPHPSLRLLLEMFCVLLDLPPSYEKSGQKLLMGSMFVPTITSKINEKSITAKHLEEAQVYYDDPKLTEKELERVAPALAVLYRWIDSLWKLANFNQKLTKEKKFLDEKQKEYNTFINEMKLELPSIEQVQKALEEESKSLLKSNETRKKIEEEYKKVDQRKKSIDSIFKGIDTITNKWENESKDFHQICSSLIGNSVLLSFYLAFCGPMNLNDRKDSLNEISELLKEFNIIASFENPLESIKQQLFEFSNNNNSSTVSTNLNGTFNINGLNLNSTMNEFAIGMPSAKSTSTSNSVSTFASTMTNASSNSSTGANPIINSGSWSAFDPCQLEVRHLASSIRTPLILDPEGIVCNLFSSTVKFKKLITVSQSVSNLEQILQNAISEGKVLILTNCNYLHPLVSSILPLSSFVPENKSVSLNIKVGSKLVNWDLNFKLVLITSLARISDIPNSLLSRVTIIDSSETSLQSVRASFEKQFIEFFEPELAPKILEMKRTESFYNVQVMKNERDTLDLLSDIIETQDSNPEYDFLEDENILSDLIKFKESFINSMKNKPDFSATKKQMENVINPLEKEIRMCQIFWKIISRYLILINNSAYFAFNTYLKTVLGAISNSGIHPGPLNEEQHKTLQTAISNSVFQLIFQTLPINDSLFFMFISGFLIREDGKEYRNDLKMILKHISSEINRSANFGDESSSGNDKIEVIKTSNFVSLFKNLLEFIQEMFGKEYETFIPFFQFDSAISNSPSIPTIVVANEYNNPTALIQHFISLRLRHENLNIVSLYNDSDLIKNTRKMIQTSLARGNWVIVHYNEPSKSTASMLTDVFAQMSSSNINSNFRLVIITTTTKYLSRNMLIKSKHYYVEEYPSIKNNMLSLFQHHSSSIRSTTNPRAMKILSYVCALLLSSISFRSFIQPVGFATMFRLNDLAFRDVIEQLRIIIDAHPNDAPLRNLRTQIDQLICGGIGEIHDRKTIQAHTSQMIRQATLEDGFSITSKSTEKSIWKVPNGETPLANFQQIIQTIPFFTTTEVLHMNSEPLLNWNLSVWMTAPYIKFNRYYRHSDNIDFKNAMMKVDNFVMLIPDIINDKEITSNSINSISVFLVQEIDKMNQIILFLKEELNRITYELMKGISSSDAIDFYEGRIPKHWRKTTNIWNHFSINSFASHVIERHSQLTRSIKEKNPCTFDLRFIEFPETLLRSFILDIAINENQPLDCFTYQFYIVDDDEYEIKEKSLILKNAYLANADYVVNFDSQLYSGDDENNIGELVISKRTKNIKLKPFKQVKNLVAKVVTNTTRQIKLFQVPLYKNALISSMEIDAQVNEIKNGESINFVWNVALPTDVPEIEMQQYGTTLFCRVPEQFF